MKISRMSKKIVHRLQSLVLLTVVALLLGPAGGVCQAADVSDDFTDVALNECWQVGQRLIGDDPTVPEDWLTISHLPIPIEPLSGGAEKFLQLKGLDPHPNSAWQYYSADMLVFGEPRQVSNDLTVTATFKAKKPVYQTHYGIAVGNQDWTDTVQLTIEQLVTGRRANDTPITKAFIVISDETLHNPPLFEGHIPYHLSAKELPDQTMMAAYNAGEVGGGNYAHMITLTLKIVDGNVSAYYYFDDDSGNPQSAGYAQPIMQKMGAAGDFYSASLFAGLWPPPPPPSPTTTDRASYFTNFQSILGYYPGNTLLNAFEYHVEDFTVREHCGLVKCGLDGILFIDNEDVGEQCATELQGECEGGTMNCVGGQIVCTQNVVSSIEVCDGLDNDCDGQVDEDMGTRTCGKGVCRRTIDVCVGGKVQDCCPDTPIHTEACGDCLDTEECGDCLDNDCDGAIDEDCGGFSCLTPVTDFCRYCFLVEIVHSLHDIPEFVDPRCLLGCPPDDIYKEISLWLNDRVSKAQAKKMAELLAKAPTGAYYTKKLKASAIESMNKIGDSKQTPSQALEELAVAVNAIALDSIVPPLAPQKVWAKKEPTADFNGVAKATFTNFESSGVATLRVRDSLPTWVKGYAPTWPIASYDFGFSGELAKDGYIDISLSLGGFNLAGDGSDLHILEWDGENYRDITTDTDLDRGVITGRTKKLSTYAIMSPAPQGEAMQKGAAK